MYRLFPCAVCTQSMTKLLRFLCHSTLHKFPNVAWQGGILLQYCLLRSFPAYFPASVTAEVVVSCCEIEADEACGYTDPLKPMQATSKDRWLYFELLMRHSFFICIYDDISSSFLGLLELNDLVQPWTVREMNRMPVGTICSMASG